MKKYRVWRYLTILGVVAGVSFSCKSPTSPSGGTLPDTTSNNFTWTQYTFGGQGGSSYFSDVAILNDTLAFAVGDIYANDSSGQSNSQPYNLAIWNGKTWSLQRLIANGYPPPIKCIFALNDHDVWLSPWFHWDGQSFQQVASDPMFFGVGINRIWGDQNGIYAVGTNGFIAHRDLSGTWTQLQSGTSLPIQDIWGATDPKTGEEEILAVAGEPTVSFDRAILSIEGMTVNKISDTPISYDLFSVWFVPEKHYYVAGDGIYEKDLLSDSLWADSVQQITTYYTTCVRGNGVNDVFIAGAFGELLHWDGASWKSFKDQTSLSNGSYSGVAVHGNLVIAVGGNLTAGDIDSKAVVTIGRR
jgi:hypothetical protein